MRNFCLIILCCAVFLNTKIYSFEAETFKQYFGLNVMELIPSIAVRSDSQEYVFRQLSELQELYPDKGAYATAIAFYNAKISLFNELGIRGPLVDHSLRAYCIGQGPKQGPWYKMLFGAPKLELEELLTPEVLASKIFASLETEETFSLQELNKLIAGCKFMPIGSELISAAAVEGYEQICQNFYAAHDLVGKATLALKNSEQRLELKKEEMKKILESAIQELRHFTKTIYKQEVRIKKARKTSGIELVSNLACIPVFIGTSAGLFGGQIASFFVTKATVAPVSRSMAFLQAAKGKIADYGATKFLDYVFASALKIGN
jgi:hypothetical protein